MPHISTGDLFRANLSQQTPLGVEAKRYMDAGELVPDAVTVEMVRARLADDDAAKGFLLDGFPRTISQAESLGEILADAARHLDAVVELQVPEDELVARLLARGRSDDTEDVIRRRQQVYRDETSPLLDHLPRQAGLRRRHRLGRGDHRPASPTLLPRAVTRARGGSAGWSPGGVVVTSSSRPLVSSTRCARPVHWWRGPSPRSPRWRSPA